MDNLPPWIIQFKKKLEKRTVLKSDAQTFDNTRQKREAGSPERVEADRLWEEYQRQESRMTTPKEQAFKDQAAKEREKKGTWGKAPAGNSNAGGSNRPHAGGNALTRADTNNAGAALPKVLGLPFHNPYTFIRFPENVKRGAPTLLTVDEVEPDRFTGILELDVKTLSPLMTCAPQPISGDQNSHKTYPVLAIEQDVIVPATGIRGALRSLMGLIAGTLGHVDEELWLCQGRDLPLGPASPATRGKVPEMVCLAEVVEPGNAGRSGTVRLGETRLMKYDELDNLAKKKNFSLKRPSAGKRQSSIWVDDSNESISTTPDGKHTWCVKLSGRPINPNGKREGLFKPDPDPTKVIALDSLLWMAYTGQNRHGDRPELKAGDLVWLEAKPGKSPIRSAEDVASIQWARWGRRGKRLLELIRDKHPNMMPDSINPDGKVDVVTNLFGQIPRPEITEQVYNWNQRNPTPEWPGPATAMAARIRPENLVFRDAITKVERVALAPLAPPHPGCVAFYRDNPNPDSIGHNDPLRGYKVYRNTLERNGDAPWHFKNQGTYNEFGKIQPPQQKVNKTVDLLQENLTGHLRIAVRALNPRELAFLLQTCTVDWRLGGGKPLGLGHCRVIRVKLLDEDGNLIDDLGPENNGGLCLPQKYREPIEDLLPRFQYYQATQKPVRKLRYPRGVSQNRIQRGGHVWFQRHAKPKMSADNSGVAPGLQVLYTRDKLQQQAQGDRVAAQILPQFKPDNIEEDVLFGYDGITPEVSAKLEANRITRFGEFHEFSDADIKGTEQSGGNTGPNRNTRHDDRKNR